MPDILGLTSPLVNSAIYSAQEVVETAGVRQ